MVNWKPIIVIVSTLAIAACSAGAPRLLSPEEIAAVKTAHQAYADAWLAGDPEGVMATLTEDAVMIPHHGVRPIVGADAIRAFWWPADAPPTKVLRYQMTVSEVDGVADIAFLWGRSLLEFEFDGTVYFNDGNYLSLMRRDSEGRWRIARRIWNDPVPDQVD